MIDLSTTVVESVLVIVTTLAGYVAWVARRLSSWIDEQERRTEANETRSVFTRRELASAVEDADVDDLPPADDPADDRLATDGGSR